jgi:hypothetical protein
MPKPTFYIGVDTGTNTGICIWSTKTKEIVKLETLPIYSALHLVRIWHEFPGDVFVRLEDARLRKWIPKQKNEKAERGRREGAGYVKAHAQIWESFLNEHGIPHELVAPKNNKTKVTADYFKKLTGWTGQTNEHCRDAAMLVVGM